MWKLFMGMGSISAFLSVAIGAFGAHALKDKLTANDMLDVYHTGVQYQMYHSLGLIVIALVMNKLGQSTLLTWSGWSMLVGIILFSGSLYVLSISGVKWLGAITPLGGVGFLAAWLLLAVAAFKAS
ncbi:MAG: hypothetical protein A2189_00565 [Paenibacillus sp. RIFOXYA1_FULL_44_5]|nr:MAG: hypothetical protein A2189_00565 [Paenibacillus sp. RIFOXYA1_FULL_44_5]